MTGYKVLTHDYRSPIQWSEPLFTGDNFPVNLPPMPLDTGSNECAAGWNFMATLEEAFMTAGWWPTGRPARAFRVEGGLDSIQRGRKCRSSTLTILAPVSETEILEALQRFSSAFHPHEVRMAEAQAAWRRALARPRRESADVIEAHLRDALACRALSWRLQRYETALGAWMARKAWETGAPWVTENVELAWNAGLWDIGAAWMARSAWDAWVPRVVWAAYVEGEAGGAAGVLGTVESARSARDALTVMFVRLQGWKSGDPMQLTIGLRDAYEAGLEFAVPTGPSELGWVMAPNRKDEDA